MSEEIEHKTESSQDNLTREDYLFLTQTYEKANSNDGMLLGIKKCIELDSHLNKEERRLFSLAYSNTISKIRKNLRYINHEIKKLNKSKNAENSNQGPILQELKQSFEKEIISNCEEVQNYIDSVLFPVLTEDQIEEKIFYLKMKGDYFRYLCEIIHDENLEGISEETESCYRQALKAAEETLPISSPVRIGVALNLSVFYAEIKNDKQMAINLANETFTGAMSCLEELEKKQNKEVLFLVKMLEENMKLWGKNFEEKGDSDEEE